MKVIVIGGGVVGVTTAYYLLQAGMNVTVIESQTECGLETSAGNAGLISPSDSFAWASPSALKIAIKSLLYPDLGIKYQLGKDPKFWRWSVEFLMQCRQVKFLQNSDAKYRLADYSLNKLNELRQDTDIDFDALDNGILYACRDKKALDKLAIHYQFLQDRGLEIETLDRDALIEKLPVLRENKEIYAGAVYSPNCQTGDSSKFSKKLSEWCMKNNNCDFLLDTKVERIHKLNNRITSLWTSKGELKADAYVLAAGNHSAHLAQQVGIRLPITPIKGFSITANIINEKLAPSIGFDDTQKLVALSRIGNRLRIASSAVFDGYNKSHCRHDFNSILNLAKEIFPSVADYDKAEYWAGLRPMTPTSVPIVGETEIENLFLNVGHGHLGWTMSCGTSCIVADRVAGKMPEINPSPYKIKYSIF